jgi:dipeptidyl-peptidase 4
MKQLLIVLVLLGGILLPVSAKNSLVLDSVVVGKYEESGITEMYSLQDGKRYASIDEDGTRVVSFDYRTGKLAEVLLDLKTAKGQGPSKITNFIVSPVENRILVWGQQYRIYRRSYLTEYYLFDRRRNTIEPLSSNGPQRDAKFSPDGRSIAFGRDNNLFIRRLDFGTELQVTTDGKKDAIINGVSDWVYEEEFANTCAFDWSPDGLYLCYVKTDESSVPTFTLPLYGAQVTPLKPNKYYPSSYSFKYPSAGEKNARVSVWAYSLLTRSAKKMDVPMDEEDYIPRIRFTLNSNQLAVMVLNRSQTVFKMYFMNPKSTKGTLILTDQSDVYVEPSYDDIRFYGKYFTYISEKSGFRHLYLYGANGGLQRQLTTGKWEVSRFLGCDTIQNIFYYQSNEVSPLGKVVCSVDLKGRKRLLTPQKGVNKAEFNSDFSLFVQTWTDLNTPPVYSLIETRDGKVIRTLNNNGDLRKEISELALPGKEFITVSATDGESLNGWMLKPAGFDSRKKYPVILVQYSGPSSQSVQDAFDLDWEYYLAQEGFLVVCVDGRGTGGRGTAFRQSTQSRLGQLEAEDQVAVAKWLKGQSYVDGARLGIWGWSFGGTIVLKSMMDKSGIFKAGVSVAPVVDWRYYNTVYTERFMRAPKENGDGYDRVSVLVNAADLKGHLLLVQGMADDNVRSNQFMDLSEAFIRAGVQFDMQVYPTSNHSILGATYRKHLYHRMFDFFQKNL